MNIISASPVTVIVTRCNNDHEIMNMLAAISHLSSCQVSQPQSILKQEKPRYNNMQCEITACHFANFN